jgi:ADP-heptose:LPS heptosyltransferase
MNDIANQLIEEFLTANRKSGAYLHDRISRLAQLSIATDQKIAEAASKALFANLVEPLADSFEPSAASLYSRVLSQVIDFCRKDPQALNLDRELSNLGLTNYEDIISRAEKLRRSYRSIRVSGPKTSIKKVIILSRVTIGADIAVTSVVIDRIEREFQRAEIVLIAGAKAIELFRGNSRVHFEEIDYSRSGTTIERFSAWIELLSAVRRLTAGLSRNEYWIIDPDSRLTQLGLLPLEPVEVNSTNSQRRVNEDCSSTDPYLFFPSREYGSDTNCSIGVLTSRWLDEIFAESVRTYPSVRLCDEDIHAGRKLLARIKRGSRPIISINFGVGGNAQKSVSGDFEAELVNRLLKQQGASIVLDKGAGKDENERADSVIASATQIELQGRRVRAVTFDEQGLNSLTIDSEESEILVWKGRIGILAALISQSDLYIGYDSAGQHIAAALGVRCIDVFAGFSSQRFVDRWRPDGRAETRVITVDTTETAKLVELVLASVNEML